MSRARTGEFENGRFILKTYQVFSVHNAPEVFVDATIVFWENLTPFFSKKHRFQKGFCPHENETPLFSNSFGLKSVFEKICFRSG